MEVKTSTCRCWPQERIGHVGVMWDKYMLIWGGFNDGPKLEGEEYMSPHHLWIYDTELEIWCMKKVKRPEDTTEHFMIFDSPIPGVSGACALCVNATLYIFSGHTFEGSCNDIYALDLSSLSNTDLQWQRIELSSDMTPSPRDKVAAWDYRDKLYFFGGFCLPFCDEDGYLRLNGEYIVDVNVWGKKGWTNQLVVFDLATNKWSNPAVNGDYICPRAAHACARIGDCVYISGGRCLATRLDDIYCLQLDTLTSTKIIFEGDIHLGRSWHCINAISNEHVFLYGGFSTTQETLGDSWLLDVKSGAWTRLKHIPQNCPVLWHTGCSTTDGDVLVFGGQTNNILDHSVDNEFSDKLLTFRISPKSLKRLSMDTAFCHRELLQQNWQSLPKHLCKALNIKLNHLQSCQKPEEYNMGRDVVQNQNVTCVMS